MPTASDALNQLEFDMPKLPEGMHWVDYSDDESVSWRAMRGPNIDSEIYEMDGGPFRTHHHPSDARCIYNGWDEALTAICLQIWCHEAKKFK